MVVVGDTASSSLGLGIRPAAMAAAVVAVAAAPSAAAAAVVATAAAAAVASAAVTRTPAAAAAPMSAARAFSAIKIISNQGLCRWQAASFTHGNTHPH